MTSILLAIIGVIIIIIGGTLIRYGGTHAPEHTKEYFQNTSEDIEPETSTKIPPFEEILNISSKKYSDSDAPIQINISEYLYYLNSKFNNN